MDNKFLKKVYAVILGVCAVVVLLQLVSLITNIVTWRELIYFAGNDKGLHIAVLFVKNTSIALVCLLAVTFAACAFACIKKNAVFTVAAGGLCLLVAICCIAFFAASYVTVCQKLSESLYTVYSTYWSGLITLTVGILVISSYFIAVFVLGLLKNKKCKKEECAAAEETRIAEEVESEENN